MAIGSKGCIRMDEQWCVEIVIRRTFGYLSEKMMSGRGSVVYIVERSVSGRDATLESKCATL